MKCNVYCCYALVELHQCHVIIYFLFLFLFFDLPIDIYWSSIFKFRCYYVKCYHLHMPLLYGILTVTNRLQPPHLSYFFFFINFQLFSLHKLISMVFNGIIYWVFFPFFQSWLKSVCQNPIKLVQEIESGSRACKRS